MIKISKFIVTLVTCLCVGGLSAHAQALAFTRTADNNAVFRVLYYVNHSNLDPVFQNNAAALMEMDQLLDSLLKAGSPVHIKLDSGASPEGTEDENVTLGMNRSERMRLYLLTHHPDLEESDIDVFSTGSDWVGLARALERSQYPWKDDAVYIMNNTPVWVRDQKGALADSRKRQLMNLQGGNPWREMLRDIFPSLRRTTITVSFPMAAPEPKQDTVFLHTHQLDTVYLEKEVRVEAEKPKYGFMLRSNLAHDIATVPSIGTQIYFGAGLALDLNWSGSWWSMSKKNRFWRMYGAEAAFRYFFRRPQDNATGMFRSLTGHHLGVYGQMVTYDIEWGGKGYLGGMEGRNIFAAPTWSAGLEYGYTLPISKHFNLDFALGVGYMRGPIQEYIHNENGGYARVGEPRMFQWIGPTRLEITLQWLMGIQNKR